MPSSQTKSSAESVRVYRRRLNASGGQEVLFQLPKTTVALIDEIKERQGLRSRSQALLQLIELGRESAKQPRDAKARLAGRASKTRDRQNCLETV